MIRLALVLVLTVFAPFQAGRPYGISYRLAMPRPASHLFEVAVDVSIPPTEQASFVDFQSGKIAYAVTRFQALSEDAYTQLAAAVAAAKK